MGSGSWEELSAVDLGNMLVSQSNSFQSWIHIRIWNGKLENLWPPPGNHSNYPMSRYGNYRQESTSKDRQLLVFPLPRNQFLSLSLSPPHCVCMLSCFSLVRFFVTLWPVASQAPLSMGILQARILGAHIPNTCSQFWYKYRFSWWLF